MSKAGIDVELRVYEMSWENESESCTCLACFKVLMLSGARIAVHSQPRWRTFRWPGQDFNRALFAWLSACCGRDLRSEMRSTVGLERAAFRLFALTDYSVCNGVIRVQCTKVE